MDCDNQDSVCPVCCNKFPLNLIESHVNKCLFLNSTESVSPSTSKRPVSGRTILEPSRKKTRVDSEIEESHSPDDIEPNLKSQSEETSFKTTGPNIQTTKTSSMQIVKTNIPLAEQLRPNSLDDYVGQRHVLSSDKVLRLLLDKHDVPSMILWGPPGCGKTTLAHIIAYQCKQKQQGTRFVKLSATMSGVNDVKEIVKVAANEQRNFKRRTILFMDEIHRFNKLQQDIFLPHVENGTIVLIGATTENPSFSLNSALLSRCRVIVLEKLISDDLYIILKRAVNSLGWRLLPADENETHCTQSTSESFRWSIDADSIQWLAEMSDGDARNALNSLQMALRAKVNGDDPQATNHITLNDIKDGIKRSHLLYDKKGDEHYTIISAVHKSIRASDENATLYWVTRMLEGGEDPVFIGRRLVRAASEDIGLADPSALPLAIAAMQGCQLLGMPECDVLLAQCAVYLARAPKSQEVYRALLSAKSSISDHKGPQPGVPLHLRNSNSKLTTELGWGKKYNMRHKDESGLIYMPDGMENVNFFK